MIKHKSVLEIQGSILASDDYIRGSALLDEEQNVSGGQGMTSLDKSRESDDVAEAPLLSAKKSPKRIEEQ